MFGSEAKSDYNEPVGIEVADGKVQPCTWMLISERIKRNAILPIDTVSYTHLSRLRAHRFFEVFGQFQRVDVELTYIIITYN